MTKKDPAEKSAQADQDGTQPAKPRLATGQDFYRAFAHDGPPDEIALLPRKKVIQKRRAFPKFDTTD